MENGIELDDFEPVRPPIGSERIQEIIEKEDIAGALLAVALGSETDADLAGEFIREWERKRVAEKQAAQVAEQRTGCVGWLQRVLH